MQISIIVSRSGKTSIYLGSGALRYSRGRAGYCVFDKHRPHWYFDGLWEYDGQRGILVLHSPKGGKISDLDGFTQLVSKRVVSRQVLHFPLKVIYQSDVDTPIEIRITKGE